MPSNDLVIGRGQRKSTPLGTSLFVGLRAIDLLLQRYILLVNPLAALAPILGLSGASSHASNSPSPSTALTPLQSVIWAMSIGSALKQIIWILYISNEPMSPTLASMICAFNTVFNSINSLLATANLPYQYVPKQTYFGGALCVVGILLELVSELQRKRFKDDPANKGKPYAGGLFSLARSINYGGYTLWRSGYVSHCSPVVIRF